MSSSGATAEKQQAPIVFFGSGPVAAASLELLAQSFTIEAVVTKPRPPHHRGSMPVVDMAQAYGYRIIEVSSKKDVSEKVALEHFRSSLAVLIDFGIIIGQDVIDAFPLGIVNSHFSLLPEWRGADPITSAILSGQVRTGVCLMLLVEAMDEGPIIAFGVQDLDNGLTAPSLTQKLIHLSNSLLCDHLPRYIKKNERSGIAQDQVSQLITDFEYPSQPSYSRKLSKKDGLLDFTKPAVQLEREIRGFIEWPKSRMIIAGKDVVITAAHVITSSLNRTTGKVFLDEKQLCVQTSDGVLAIDHLKPSGKPEMSAVAFIAGYGNKL